MVRFLTCLRVFAVRLSTSSVSKVHIVVKLQKHDIFTSCSGLRVLTAKELVVALLACALFLGCTEPLNILYILFINLFIHALFPSSSIPFYVRSFHSGVFPTKFLFHKLARVS